MADANMLDLTEVEDDRGRILTGAGVSQESLEEVIDAHEERHAPAEAESKPDQHAPSDIPKAEADKPGRVSANARDGETGQFTKPTRGQRRFDQLTKEREDAKREAQGYRERYEKLEAELKARPAPESSPRDLSAPSPTPSPAASVRAPEPGAAPTPSQRPRPTPDEVGTKYQTWRDYEDDLFSWRDEQKAQNLESLARQVFAQQQAESQFYGYVNSVREKGRSKYPDFDQKIHDPAFDAIHFPGPTLQAIAEAPSSEDIQYALASDHALAKRLAAEANPYRVGMILASLSGGSAATPASTPTPVASTPPPPYQPVGGRAKTATPSLDELANTGDDYDKSGYRERRRREREGR